jgi:aldehyde:ferredoxin oxidoreductase
MQSKIIKQRGGKTAHPCHRGCVIRCSRIYKDKQGEYVTKGPEFETIWANGPNLGIADLDAISQIDRLADDYGLDTIEMGNAIGVAMEAGLISFGDTKGAINLYKEVAKGTPLGRIIGSGATTLGKVFGVDKVAAVKGQSFPAYDPRAIKGIGVTYATSTMGADHTAGYTVPANILGLGERTDPLGRQGQVALSKKMQVATAAIDCTGLCLFCALMMVDKTETFSNIVEMVNARYGWQWTNNDFFNLGKKVLKLEREFNLKAGFTPADDRLPEFFYEDPLPPHNSVFDIASDEIQTVFEL